MITEPPVEAQHLAFYPYSSDLPFLIASGEAERVQEQVLNVLIPQAWEGAELSQLQTLAESIADRFDAILDRGSCRRLSLAALQAARWLHEQLGDRKPAVLWNRPFRMAVDRQQIYAGQVDLLVQGAEGWTAIDWRYGSQKDAARWDVSLYRLQLERLQRGGAAGAPLSSSRCWNRARRSGGVFLLADRS
ncbi:MAG: hypothetical protein KatS3mg115_1242 [Candidatus Poribacteria bacterium]|nr:MAG: hypothetical protein KatS3mg115_1242 [Candidatus Poribacteria bacterium]